MTGSLETLFETIVAPVVTNANKPLYAVLPVLGYQSYYVGKDNEERACLLVATINQKRRQPSPIRLESIDVQFDLPCHLTWGQVRKEGYFTVIRCRAHDTETIRYFLSVCETVLRMAGDEPDQATVSLAVHRLASIFQKAQKPPTRTVQGLFGELFLIFRSSNPIRTLSAWRADETARFDFVDGDVRLDVKATSKRQRSHVFSYEQCNPPPGTIAVAASLFAERVSNGLSMRKIIAGIASDVASNPDLVFKLHEVTASTLGSSLNEALEVTFDAKLAESSLKFFDLAELPAIRSNLPDGVSEVRFRSDLSVVECLSAQMLMDREPIFWDLLPLESQGR
jgi:hypothetical protein